MTAQEQLVSVEIVEDDVEEWRIIGGFDDYSVSNLGRVRDDTIGQILRAGLNGWGYLTLHLFKHNELGAHSKHIHKLVATAFLGDSNGLEVNHIDHNKRNNKAHNLEYCTRSANNRNGWSVEVRGPNNGQITVSWTP